MMKTLIFLLLPAWAFSQANPQGVQEVTSGGASITLNNDVSIVYIDPPTKIANLTINFPATPSDRQRFRIYFGGTIADGDTVIRAVTLNGNGNSIKQSTAATYIVGGDYLVFSYNRKRGRWDKDAGATKSILDQYMKVADTAKYIIRSYNAAGRMVQLQKEWISILDIPNGNAMTIDISAAGFTNVTGVFHTVQANTNQGVQAVMAHLKTVTTGQLAFNISQGAGVTVAGIGVAVLGFVGNSTGYKLHVLVKGY